MTDDFVHRSGLSFKAVGDDGTIEGYASTFGNIDQGEDIVASGAFTAWLQANAGRPLPMLFAHKSDRVCGVWTGFQPDAKGLFVRGKITRAAPTGAEVYALAKDGAITGLSIGYRVRDSSRDLLTGIRTLLALALHEVSVTAFPMNEEAQITRVKSAQGSLEGLLEAVTMARRQIHATPLHGLLTTVRDARADTRGWSRR